MAKSRRKYTDDTPISVPKVEVVKATTQPATNENTTVTIQGSKKAIDAFLKSQKLYMKRKKITVKS